MDMSFSGTSFLINPDLLVWARKSIGYNTSQAAHSIGVKEDMLLLWESGEVPVPINKLSKLSLAYKRPSAVFLLNNVPDEKAISKFRVLFENLGLKTDLSKSTLLAIRRSLRIQGILSEEIGLKTNDFLLGLNKMRSTSDYTSLANTVAKLLNVNYEAISEFKTPYEALNYWKSLVEDKQIVVLETGLPRGETRGFYIHDDVVPVIVLNTNDVPQARIFTLLHELGHLSLGKDSADNENTLENFQSGLDEEVFCNYFAGSLAIPQILLTNLIGANTAFSLDMITGLSHYFWVSREVVSRRLLINGLINSQMYKNLIADIHADNAKYVNVTKSHGGNYYTNFLKNNSRYFVNEVFKAYSSNRISFGDIINYLNIKPKTLPGLETKLFGFS